MNKKLIFYITTIFIIVIAFSVFSFFCNSELKKIKKAVNTLTRDITMIKEEYILQVQLIDSKLNLLINNLDSIQDEYQNQNSNLKKQLYALQDNFRMTKSQFINSLESLSTEALIAPIPPHNILTSESTVKIQVMPEDVRLNTYFSTGKEAFGKCNYTKAREAFAQLLEIKPPLWEAQLYYIQAAYYENPGKAATDTTIQRLLDSLPDEYNTDGVVTKLHGLFAMERGAFSEAADKLFKYQTFRKEAESLLALGECYLALKKQNEAAGIFNDIVSSFPGSVQAGIAAAYLKKIR